MFKKLKQWWMKFLGSSIEVPNVTPPPKKALEETIALQLEAESKKDVIAFCGDPNMPLMSGDSQPSKQQRNKHGHKFDHAEQDGYGVCKCGARENTDASVERCPLAGKKRKRKRYRGKKPKAQA